MSRITVLQQLKHNSAFSEEDHMTSQLNALMLPGFVVLPHSLRSLFVEAQIKLVSCLFLCPACCTQQVNVLGRSRSIITRQPHVLQPHAELLQEQ